MRLEALWPHIVFAVAKTIKGKKMRGKAVQSPMSDIIVWAQFARDLDLFCVCLSHLCTQGRQEIRENIPEKSIYVATASLCGDCVFIKAVLFQK